MIDIKSKNHHLCHFRLSMCGLTSSQRISLSRQTSLASHILRVSAGDDASGDASGASGDGDGDVDEEVVGRGIMYFAF